MQVEQMLMSSKDAEILLAMAGGDRQRAIDAWLELPTNHVYRTADIK